MFCLEEGGGGYLVRFWPICYEHSGSLALAETLSELTVKHRWTAAAVRWSLWSFVVTGRPRRASLNAHSTSRSRRHSASRSAHSLHRGCPFRLLCESSWTPEEIDLSSRAFVCVLWRSTFILVDSHPQSIYWILTESTETPEEINVWTPGDFHRQFRVGPRADSSWTRE